MSKFSLTIAGVLVAVGGTLLVQFGFSDVCSNEIVNKLVTLLPVVLGGGMSWVGRFKTGGITPLGFKK